MAGSAAEFRVASLSIRIESRSSIRHGLPVHQDPVHFFFLRVEHLFEKIDEFAASFDSHDGSEE